MTRHWHLGTAIAVLPGLPVLLLLPALLALLSFYPMTAGLAGALGAEAEESGLALLQRSALSGRQRAAGPSSAGAAGPAGGCEGLPVYMPVASSVWAVIIVLLTYFLFYAVLQGVRRYNVATGGRASRLRKVLESTASNVCCAPMLCVLLLAVYNRADLLSACAPLEHNLPRRYVRTAIMLSSVAFCAQLVLYGYKEWRILRDVMESPPAEEYRRLAMVDAVQTWSSLFNAAMTGMYVAMCIVLFGCLRMAPTQEVQQELGPRPPSPGTQCSIWMAIVYFAVYGMMHMANSKDVESYLTRVVSAEQEPGRFTIEVLKLAMSIMNFAPMLSVFFLGTQMMSESEAGRTHDGLLPDYIETITYMSFSIVFLQVALVLLMPFLAGAQLQATEGPTEVHLTARHRQTFLLIGIIRWVSMALLYGGVFILGNYLWMLRAPPLWVRLLTHLGSYFFLVHFLLWVALTLRQARGGMATAVRTLTTAKDTVTFCPMLAVLFLMAWVSAGRLVAPGGGPGVPQGSSQDCMVMATLALLVQVLLVILGGLAWRAPGDAEVAERLGVLAGLGRDAIELLSYAALAVMYVSLLVVIVSLFTLAPETATGKGAWIT